MRQTHPNSALTPFGRALAAHQVSAPEVAEALSVTTQAVHHWRLGRNLIPAARAQRLAGLTNIPLHELRPDIWPKPLRGNGGTNGTRVTRRGGIAQRTA